MPQDATAQNIATWLLLRTIAPYRHPLLRRLGAWLPPTADYALLSPSPLRLWGCFRAAPRWRHGTWLTKVSKGALASSPTPAPRSTMCLTIPCISTMS